MTMWLVGSAILAVCLAYFFVKPFFEPALSASVEISGHDSLRALLDSKERALRALKDLELDYSMGKVGAEDFETSRKELTAAAGRILEDIKRHGRR